MLLEEIFADLRAIDPSRIGSPADAIREGEVVLGVANSEVRQLYHLWDFLDDELRSEINKYNTAYTKGEATSDHCIAVRRMQLKFDMVQALFGASVQYQMGLFDDEVIERGVDIRQGWQIVMHKEKGILGKFKKFIGTG